eukprot:GFYU01006083.1.p1 GENE.GFYU01006083.1~~GFYU01006083.1.p1  ORF type:complete len:503 (-),score=118.67 GFYU01006083.1:127-1635(-)
MMRKAARPRPSPATVSRPPVPSTDGADASTIPPPPQHASYSILFKGFLVWILFTFAGWISIPPEWLPLFSHAVGFGFYLVIITKQTRWLGALCLGTFSFLGVVYFTIPPEWYVTTTNTTGYGAMFVVVFFLWLLRRNSRRMQERMQDVLNNMKAAAAARANYTSDRDTSDVDVDELLLEIEGPGAARSKGRSVKKSAKNMRKNQKKSDDVNIETEAVPSTPDSVTDENVSTDAPDAPSLTELTLSSHSVSDTTSSDATSDIAALSKELDELKAGYSKLHSQYVSLQTACRSTEASIRTALKDKKAAEAESAKWRKQLGKAESEQQRAVTSLKLIQQKLAETETVRDKHKKDAEQASKAVDNEATRAAGLDEKVTELTQQVESLNKSLAAKQQQKKKGGVTKVRRAQDLTYDVDAMSIDELDQCESHLKALLAQLPDRKMMKLRSEYERLQESKLCKICQDRDVNSVFVPCGHQCCCHTCAQRMKDCPMCRKPVTQRLRTFES